jgi:hypothetical protein
MRWFVIIILYCLCTPQSAWCDDIVLRIGTVRINATVASTTKNRQRGLMHITQLCENCGMLFVFPQAGKHNFWMKETQLPLSIAFITADGTIINLSEMEANTTVSHSPQGLALYALEMNKGWFDKHGVKPKTRIEGLQTAPSGR